MSLEAARLAAGLPALLVAAERVAASVAPGLHGRRRVGAGESFWQFRPYVAGDPTNRIDWRRSARSDRLQLRETEWEAAQTVTLWRDGGASMRWRSAAALPEKKARAELILLALASLLLRGGERIRLLSGEPAAPAATLPALAAALDHGGSDLAVAPPAAHGELVLIGDFLGSLAPLRHLLGQCAALPVRGTLLQVLDPAEISLPYRGRVRFEAADGTGSAVIPEVDRVRDAYKQRLRDRQDELARLARAAGFGFLVHTTDQAAQLPLLALHEAMTA